MYPYYVAYCTWYQKLFLQVVFMNLCIHVTLKILIPRASAHCHDHKLQGGVKGKKMVSGADL
jgi:hypothetical protein